MAFLKRPEVWILLLLSAAGIGYVLWSDGKRDDRESAEDPPIATPAEGPEETTSRFLIGERRVAREGDHLILSLRVIHSPEIEGGGEPLPASEDEVQLRSGDGTSVRRFFLPFDPPPSLESRPGAHVDLRFWIPLAQADSDLWLEWKGERLAVKEPSEGTDWTEAFPEGVEVAVDGTAWNPSS